MWASLQASRRTVDRPARETLPALSNQKDLGGLTSKCCHYRQRTAPVGTVGRETHSQPRARPPAHEGSEGGFGTKLLNTHGL